MKTTGVMLKDRSQAIAGPGEAGAIDGPGN